MLDIKEIRKDQKFFKEKLLSKDPEADLEKAISSYETMCAIKAQAETLKATMNQKAKEIGLKKRNGEDVTDVMNSLSQLKEEIATIGSDLKSAEETYQTDISKLPNIPDSSLKESLDPEDNVLIKTVGTKTEFAFETKNHVELNEKLKYFDFKTSAKLSGTGWPLYTDMGAKIEWALFNLMLSTHIKNGFRFILPPHLVNPEIMYGCGQLPKFGHQVFQLKDDDHHHYLLPTAEVALGGMHHSDILKEEDLPIKYVAYTPCFRREAGASGTGERGLIRMHQFNKVELFAYTTPDNSETVFNEMLASAEEILQKLGLHYRNMLLVTGDTSFSASKTIDIEVWLPGQDKYMEVSSVSNCTDFQARRSHIRYRKSGEKTQFVHTLNGSGLATSRLFVAIMENFQQPDGSIDIPPALKPFIFE